MIYIRKNQANTVVLTLNEKAVNSSYDVLFEFINEISGDVKAFTCDDESLVSRYNKFSITESDSENLYNGQIKLEPGQWKYTAYEMPVASPKSLDKDNSVGTLEIGRVTVYESETTNEFTANEDKSTPTFE